MSAKDFADVGCNESAVHTDFMISSEEVNVTAISETGSEIALLKNGLWVM